MEAQTGWEVSKQQMVQSRVCRGQRKGAKDEAGMQGDLQMTPEAWTAGRQSRTVVSRWRHHVVARGCRAPQHLAFASEPAHPVRVAKLLSLFGPHFVPQ